MGVIGGATARTLNHYVDYIPLRMAAGMFDDGIVMSRCRFMGLSRPPVVQMSNGLFAVASWLAWRTMQCGPIEATMA